MNKCLVLGALLLAACSGGSGVTKADIAALEVTLTTADRLALEYTKLPPCSRTVVICSDPATKARIKTDALKAYDLFKVLQVTQSSAAFTETQRAILALHADIPPEATP